MYYVWENILNYDQENKQLNVNLLLNRASKWADIDSYIPYIGRVDIKLKTDCNIVKVRMNDWVDVKMLTCRVDGEKVVPNWDGNYMLIKQAKSGQKIVIEFPIEEKTKVLESFGHKYTGVFRGNDCVDISPRGKYIPTFQKGSYRTGKPRFIKVKRFVCDNEISY